MGETLNRLISLGGTGIKSPVVRYQEAKAQNEASDMNRLSMLASKQTMGINQRTDQRAQQAADVKILAPYAKQLVQMDGTPEQKQAAYEQVLTQLPQRLRQTAPEKYTDQMGEALMTAGGLEIDKPVEKWKQGKTESGVPYQESSLTGERKKGVGVDASASSKGAHFSGQKIFKDSEGTLFMGTGIGDPASGRVTPSMVAVNGSDIKPKGKLRLVNTLGQTSGEIPRYKSEILRREALEKDDVNFYTDYIDETRNLESSVGELEMTQRLLNDLSGQAKYSTTGFAKFINKIPLTDANRWSELKSTIQSRIAMGKMLELKEASQTGSTGFGQLSEKELKVLMDHLGSLEQAQSPKAIKKVVGQIYETMEGVKQGYRRKMLQNKKRFKTLHKEYYGKSRELPSLGDELTTSPQSQQVQTKPNVQLRPEDEVAVQWAKANPNDPRAIEILKRNGIN